MIRMNRALLEKMLKFCIQMDIYDHYLPEKSRSHWKISLSWLYSVKSNMATNSKISIYEICIKDWKAMCSTSRIGYLRHQDCSGDIAFSFEGQGQVKVRSWSRSHYKTVKFLTSEEKALCKSLVVCMWVNMNSLHKLHLHN